MAGLEVAVCNVQARACVADQWRHLDLSDDWADMHCIEIEAEDEAHALDKAQRRYPDRRGYVIEAVTEIKDY